MDRGTCLCIWIRANDYIVALLWLPQTDILRGQAHDVAFGIDNASASTAGADVNSNIVIHVDVQLIVGIRRVLAGILPVLLSERH